MSEMSRDARRAMRAKAHRMVAPTAGRIDASDFTPEEPLNAEAKTGMRPISRRAFKSGGKVSGSDAPQNAGKKPRTGNKGLGALANSIVNRNLKDANEEREGVKHVGGFKRGGKADGGPTADSYVPTGRLNFSAADSRMSKAAGLKTGGAAKHAKGCSCAKCSGGSLSVSDGSFEGTRPTGGRLAKKSGGWIKDAIKHPGALHRELQVPEGKKIPESKLDKAADSDNPTLAKRANLAKTLKRVAKRDGGGIGDLELATGGRAKKGSGKTNINIIIGTGKGRDEQQASPQPPVGGPPMPPPPPPAHPMPMPMGAGMPPSGPPMMPPGGAPPMMRKTGGRVGNRRYYDNKGGAGSGLGRLQKID